MYIRGKYIDLMHLFVSIHVARTSRKGVNIESISLFNETSHVDNSTFSLTILYFITWRNLAANDAAWQPFSRTMFSVKRPYIRLLWAYFPCFWYLCTQQNNLHPAM